MELREAEARSIATREHRKKIDNLKHQIKSMDIAFCILVTQKLRRLAAAVPN